MTNIIEQLDSEQIKSDIPEFAPGDTIRVQVKVKEGSRERLQAFEGVVIARKNRGLNSSFTVRKISYGEGVERVDDGDARRHGVGRQLRRGVRLDELVGPLGLRAPGPAAERDALRGGGHLRQRVRSGLMVTTVTL